MIGAYCELMKPRLLLMAVLISLASLYIAHSNPMPWALFFKLILAATLVGGAANALNQYLERETDSKMRRTQNRPLPSGRLQPENALFFGSLLFVVGESVLFLFVNATSGFIGLMIFISYVFLYTPLKHKTPLNTFVGAIPGALPVLLGWTATGRPLDAKAWFLFALLFFWQLPHFFAIAWTYQEDYKNGGLVMLPLNDPSGKKTSISIVFFSFVIFFLSFAPAIMGLTGPTYLFMAIFFGFLLLAFSLYLATHNLSDAKKFIPLSITYLFIINISMVLDKC